jgi:DNA-binding response OmpR family regulator
MTDMGPGAVLVVEDDPSIRELLVEALENEGIRAIAASDGAEAVRLALEKTPRLVILDMGLPFVDGPTVAAQIRDAYGDAVPFMVVTAGQRISEASAMVRAASYIAKPFDIDELVRAVRSVIEPASGGAAANEAKPSVA